jgi:hypothetical protein
MPAMTVGQSVSVIIAAAIGIVPNVREKIGRIG